MIKAYYGYRRAVMTMSVMVVMALIAAENPKDDIILKLANGFSYELIIDNLGYSRQLAVFDNGDVFVAGRTSHLLEFSAEKVSIASNVSFRICQQGQSKYTKIMST